MAMSAARETSIMGICADLWGMCNFENAAPLLLCPCCKRIFALGEMRKELAIPVWLSESGALMKKLVRQRITQHCSHISGKMGGLFFSQIVWDQEPEVMYSKSLFDHIE